MNTLGSLLVIIALAGVHITIGRWHWLHRDKPSPWLGVSAGAAIAYVFVYLLPKLAIIQVKLVVVLNSMWTPLLRNQTYLIALAGFVCFFWLARADEIAERDDAARRPSSINVLLLHTVGYGLYSLLIGLLIARLPRPDMISYVLAASVLGLHMMGVDHGVRSADPASYDRRLRWVFAGALLVGWSIGISTDGLDMTFSMINAFIGGGIIITAIQDELPHAAKTRFLPFVLGVVCTSAAILAVQIAQNKGAA